MKIRQTIFIIPFIAVISLTLNSCNNPKNKKENISTDKAIISKTECVENIMEKDDSLGTIRNHFCETASLSEAITQYTNSFNGLDLSGCPDDFKSAFQKHIQAWLLMVPVTNHYPELRGELHALFDQIAVSEDSTQFNIKLKSIWDTWSVIEKTIKDQ